MKILYNYLQEAFEMTDRWDSLRSKFQGKNIDLDVEFEKFLNESLSDESLASPRHKAPSLKTKLSRDSDAGSLPWWAEEDEEEDKKREALRQSWLKPKPQKDDDKMEQEEDDTAKKTEEPQRTPVGISQDSNHGNSSAVSISKDSLEEVARKNLQDEKLISKINEAIPERPLIEEETGTYEYGDDVETGGNSSILPSHGLIPSEAPPHGLDTLQEEEEKLKFFQERLREDTQIDYKKELEEMSTTESGSPDKERDDKLQATGAELGDSIFNATDGLQDDNQRRDEAIVDKGDDQQEGDDHDDDYSDQFEETHDEQEENKVRGEEANTLATQQALEPPEPTKPSLLSKVSLMESLDSTLDRRKPEAMSQLDKAKAVEVTSASGSGLKTTGTGNLYSGTTDTIAELQAALQQVQMNTTDRSQQERGLQRQESEPEDQLLLQKSSTGETKSRGFSLRPSVVTDSSPVENQLKKRQLLTHLESAGLSLTSDTIDSTSLPMDCRGFTLKPSGPTPSKQDPGLAVDSRGIPLDSRVVPLDSHEARDSFTEEKRGLDLEPMANILAMIDKEEDKKIEDDSEEEDTPDPDSLRSIKEKAKVKARKSVDAKKREPTKKTMTKKSAKSASSPVRVRGSKGSLPETSTGVPQKKGKGKAKGSQSVGKSKLEQWQPSMSSPPSWSPTPTMRKSRHMESKMPSPKIKTKDNGKNQAVPEPSAHHLAESVESFANYLKHLVRPEYEDKENHAPMTPRWSDDEPVKSRASIRATSVDDRMERISREQRLQSEVENWQTAWKDERRRNDKLIADFAAREREWSRKEENTRMVFEEQMHDLKQEIYSLQARLQEEQENADSRKRVASGGELKGITEEEKKRLEKEIREQEKLMKGYQQENERLYKELKQIQAKGKTTEGRMFAENQKLATEVANLKEKLGQQSGQSHYPKPGSAVLGADRINYLQDQLGSYRRRETKTQKEIDELRTVNMTLEQRMRAVERERDDAVERANQALGTSTQEQSQMKIRYESEIERLNRKLKWYAENQDILDRDLVKIKVKDQEIKDLKETLERLKKQQGKDMVERKERTNERAADAKRIRDLERQVCEMEEIIKRRYPNSLPALILAASSAPGVAQPTADESPQKQSPSYLFLENQVKKLQKQLEEKDDEASRRIRAIEQKYNAMKFDYEERIRELEQSLKLANQKPRPPAHPHTHAQALEKELAAVRENDRRRIGELESEISVLQEALGRMSSLQAHAKNRKRKSDEKKPTAEIPAPHDTAPEKVQALERQLQEKDKELSDLKQTCTRLQQERESMLASPQRDTPRTTPKTPPRVAELEQQNTQLKQRLAEISLDIDQDRVRFQGSLAEAERNARQARDDAADQIEKLRAQHQREVNQLKSEFAVRHSSSVVTELKSRLASQEIVIQKLREKIVLETRNSEELAAAKTREELLKQQLTSLQNELHQARENFTPEMRHFDNLQSKISAMEQRFDQRESDLERIINTTHIKSKLEKEESDSRWKAIVRMKNQEIEKFREELDVILEALRELKRQGVVIPMMTADQY